MGVRNFLVEGVSGTGKTSVCHELRRRGFHAVNGDTDLAYQGDPVTGLPTGTVAHENHIWDLDRVRAIVGDRSEPVTFFCGGSRNHARFVDLLDGVLVLQVDRATLERRLDERPADEFGATPEQRALVLRVHETQEDVPDGVAVDATRPLEVVVSEIVRLAAIEVPRIQ
ncbi:nucleoside kinase [Nocardioides sp. Soil774]|uniref:AAA family ATPase n=1 Tax=Nocardioides sp. Soil774 TaxID=1736408 RepID=UPI0006F4C2E8|nr:AAA family ATPase [Nocardioides sp. Soil774]KRE92930.1 nucleoside kinase [Nocardioides sp. Soil774]